MSHEITSTDHLVLSKSAAWHGMENVVDTAPTPGQDLTLAPMDRKVVEADGRLAPMECQQGE